MNKQIEKQIQMDWSWTGLLTGFNRVDGSTDANEFWKCVALSVQKWVVVVREDWDGLGVR